MIWKCRRENLEMLKTHLGKIWNLFEDMYFTPASALINICIYLLYIYIYMKYNVEQYNAVIYILEALK